LAKKASVPSAGCQPQVVNHIMTVVSLVMAAGMRCAMSLTLTFAAWQVERVMAIQLSTSVAERKSITFILKRKGTLSTPSCAAGAAAGAI